MWKLILLLVVSVTMLSACDTAPVSTADAVQAPSDRVFAYQSAAMPFGEVAVTRDRGFTGSACLISVYVNGIEAARLAPGEKVALRLKPGRWNIGAGPNSEICGSARARRTAQVIVEKDDRLVYRIASTTDGLSIGPAG